MTTVDAGELDAALAEAAVADAVADEAAKAAEAGAQAGATAGICLNCGAARAGRFCANCGQKAMPLARRNWPSVFA